MTRSPYQRSHRSSQGHAGHAPTLPRCPKYSRYAKELGCVVFFAREYQLTDELVLRNDHILRKLHSASNTHVTTVSADVCRNTGACSFPARRPVSAWGSRCL